MGSNDGFWFPPRYGRRRILLHTTYYGAMGRPDSLIYYGMWAGKLIPVEDVVGGDVGTGNNKGGHWGKGYSRVVEEI